MIQKCVVTGTCSYRFGEVLRELREKRGLSQEIAGAGLSANRVSDFELGKALPRSAEVVEDIAWILECTPQERIRLHLAYECSLLNHHKCKLCPFCSTSPLGDEAQRH